MLSSSFHGRDLFAPIGARIALGEPAAGWGREIRCDRLLIPDWPDDLAEVVYIDHYGNAITGLRSDSLGVDQVLSLAGICCEYRRVFCEAPAGQVFWYGNANGLVEIAVAGGSAASLAGVAVGTPVLGAG